MKKLTITQNENGEYELTNDFDDKETFYALAGIQELYNVMVSLSLGICIEQPPTREQFLNRLADKIGVQDIMVTLFNHPDSEVKTMTPEQAEAFMKANTQVKPKTYDA